MGIHYSNGFGKLYDRETGETILNIDYQLIEPTKQYIPVRNGGGNFPVKKR